MGWGFNKFRVLGVLDLVSDDDRGTSSVLQEPPHHSFECYISRKGVVVNVKRFSIHHQKKSYDFIIKSSKIFYRTGVVFNIVRKIP